MSSLPGPNTRHKANIREYAPLLSRFGIISTSGILSMTISNGA